MKASLPAGLKTAVSRKQFEKAQNYLLPRLETELPAHLFYHNKAHVRGVIQATDYLLQKENVPEENRWMLLTAAQFHDAGFLQSYCNHEELSCAMAQETLPAFGYSPESITTICQIIMATKLPQEPTTHYEKILCDADLFYLGTDEFNTTSHNLYRELKFMGLVHSEEEWQAKQLAFLKEHCYFTATAKAELEPLKDALIRRLEQTI